MAQNCWNLDRLNKLDLDLLLVFFGPYLRSIDVIRVSSVTGAWFCDDFKPDSAKRPENHLNIFLGLTHFRLFRLSNKLLKTMDSWDSRLPRLK